MDSARKRTALRIGVVAGIAVVVAVLLLLVSSVSVRTPPKAAPSVVTVAASGVGQTNATLNGNLAALGTASGVSVGFYYGTNSSLAGAANVTAGTETAVGSFSLSLSGLTSDTAYYYRAWARGDGFSKGAIHDFTTLTPSTPQVTPPTVTTEAATGIRITNATLRGSLGSLGTASSVTVGFRYGTSPTLATAANVTVGVMTAQGDFSKVVAALTPDTTYYVQAWASGDGFATGTVVSFATHSAGNGHFVPPGWAHAACPTLPSQAPAHGAWARCTYNATWGELKKIGTAGSLVVGALSQPRTIGGITATASAVALPLIALGGMGSARKNAMEGKTP